MTVHYNVHECQQAIDDLKRVIECHDWDRVLAADEDRCLEHRTIYQDYKNICALQALIERIT